jgi:hypothetical protein
MTLLQRFAHAFAVGCVECPWCDYGLCPVCDGSGDHNTGLSLTQEIGYVCSYEHGGCNGSGVCGACEGGGCRTHPRGV